MNQFKNLITLVVGFSLLISCSGVNDDRAGGEDFPNTISDIGEKLVLFTKTQDSTPQNPQYEVSRSITSKLSRVSKVAELNSFKKVEKTTEVLTFDDSTSSIVSRYSGDTLGYDSLLVNTASLMDGVEGNEIVQAYYSSRSLGVDSTFQASIDLDGDNRILPALSESDQVLYLNQHFTPSLIETKRIKLSPGPSLNYDVERDNILLRIESLRQSLEGDTLLWELGIAADSVVGVDFSKGGDLSFQRLEITDSYRKTEFVEGFHHENQELAMFRSILSQTEFFNGRTLVESSQRIEDDVVVERLRTFKNEYNLIDTVSYDRWAFKLSGQDTLIQSFELYRSELREWSEVKVDYSFDSKLKGYATIRVNWINELDEKWSLMGEYTPEGYTAEVTGPERDYQGSWDLLGQNI